MAGEGDTNRAALAHHFGAGLKEDVVSEALSILRLYGLTPSDLYFKWEAFLLSSLPSARAANASTSAAAKNETLEFNLENLRELKKEIQANMVSSSYSNASIVKQEQGTPGMPGAGGRTMKKTVGGRAALEGILDGLPATPLAKKSKFGGTPGSATPMANKMLPSSFATPQNKKPVIPSRLGGTSANGTLTPSTPGVFDSSAPSPSTSGVRFQDRQNALEVVESLNGHLPSTAEDGRQGNHSRIALASNADPKAYSYRYMFERIKDRSEVLNDAIEEACDLIRQYYGLDELGNPDLPSQEDHYTVGRVCPEEDGVRLTETSLTFEPSKFYSSTAGNRVRLRFAPDVVIRTSPSDEQGEVLGEGGVGIFPGMLVGLKGRNAGTESFVVSEVLLMPPVDMPESPAEELIEYQHGKNKLDGKPMSIMTAAGPYTCDDDLEYEPLTALVEAASSNRPDLLILLGPFVDASHPMLKTGDVDLTPTQIFASQVSKKINSFLDYSSGSTVILVPSVRDLISYNVVYPQAPFDKEGLGLHKKARLLPNPATFSVNEVIFGITSVDTLFSLKTNEYFKRAREANEASDADGSVSGGNKDPMARLCRHVLRQRSFYPLFPSPQNPPLDPLNLDVTHANLLKLNGGVGADVFIVPSSLKYFAKVVDSAVMINPASLVRKNAAGTFAKLTIYPTDKSELENPPPAMLVDEENEEDLREHKLYERCRVDLVRI